MASVKRVFIVGGGSAGMTLATSLQRCGIDAANVEINPTWSVMRLVYRPFGSLLVPPPWFRGCVLLVGDAAQTCTSYMASGARIAIEDAIVLTELLQSDVPVSELLEKFMARRYEHCRMVVESSHPMAIWEKSPNTPGADPVGVLARANAALAAPI
jgi:2-polyprenyl-6-methoxyphenol hydroxylase-like FAD-dependent oxidoreductase